MSVVLRRKNKEHRSIINLFFTLYSAARATSVMTPNQVARWEHGTPFPATNINHLRTTYCRVTEHKQLKSLQYQLTTKNSQVLFLTRITRATDYFVSRNIYAQSLLYIIAWRMPVFLGLKIFLHTEACC